MNSEMRDKVLECFDDKDTQFAKPSQRVTMQKIVDESFELLYGKPIKRWAMFGDPDSGTLELYFDSADDKRRLVVEVNRELKIRFARAGNNEVTWNTNSLDENLGWLVTE